MKTDLFLSCATPEFSKFAGILSAALSQHHLSGCEIAQLEFHHLHSLCSQWYFLRPTWLHIPGHLITPLWLSGSWRSFLYSSSVYSWHLFLISSASVRSIPFLSFIKPIFAWNVPLVSLIFFKRSLVFPFLLFSSILCTDHWGRLSYPSLLFFGTLHSNGYLSFSPLLFTSLLSQLFLRPPQTTILPFCISFPWGWSWSLSPAQCHRLPSIVHQALYQI